MAETELFVAIDALIEEAVHREQARQHLTAENNALKDQLTAIKSSHDALINENSTKSKDLSDILVQVEVLNKQRLEFVEGLGLHFKVQADVVELKYEMEILNCKIRNMERDLMVQKAENERLRRLQQNRGNNTKFGK